MRRAVLNASANANDFRMVQSDPVQPTEMLLYICTRDVDCLDNRREECPLTFENATSSLGDSVDLGTAPRRLPSSSVRHSHLSANIILFTVLIVALTSHRNSLADIPERG